MYRRDVEGFGLATDLNVGALNVVGRQLSLGRLHLDFRQLACLGLVHLASGHGQAD